MASSPSSEAFALFVSCKEGSPVTRYGSRSLIGADRAADGVTYRPDEIVAIPTDEAARYAREYGRAIKDGDLIVRKREDWEAQQQLSAEQDESNARERDARAKAKAAAAEPLALPETAAESKE